MRVENRQARFDYEILEKVEAGVKLTGAEVKSAKAGKMSLSGSRCVYLVDDDGVEDLWVVGMQINPYEYASTQEYEPARSRKLLLSKKELVAFKSKAAAKGLTLVPLSCYNKHGLIKIEIGLVRGKKRFEKRDAIKKREEERGLAARLKQIQK